MEDGVLIGNQLREFYFALGSQVSVVVADEITFPDLRMVHVIGCNAGFAEILQVLVDLLEINEVVEYNINRFVYDIAIVKIFH